MLPLAIGDGYFPSWRWPFIAAGAVAASHIAMKLIFGHVERLAVADCQQQCPVKWINNTCEHDSTETTIELVALEACGIKVRCVCSAE
jgi:hypothetical protein